MADGPSERAIEWARAALGLAAVEARAWPVRRLDRPGADYHLVVFGTEEASVAVAAVRSDGEVAGSARLPGTAGHVTVEAAEAVRHSGLDPGADAELVFAPSRITRSPLYPVWEVRGGGRVVYVDQSGQVWPELGVAGPGG